MPSLDELKMMYHIKWCPVNGGYYAVDPYDPNRNEFVGFTDESIMDYLRRDGLYG